MIELQKNIIIRLYIDKVRRDILADELGMEVKELRKQERQGIRKMVKKYMRYE